MRCKTLPVCLKSRGGIATLSSSGSLERQHSVVLVWQVGKQCAEVLVCSFEETGSPSDRHDANRSMGWRFNAAWMDLRLDWHLLISVSGGVHGARQRSIK